MKQEQETFLRFSLLLRTNQSACFRFVRIFVQRYRRQKRCRRKVFRNWLLQFPIILKYDIGRLPLMVVIIRYKEILLALVSVPASFCVLVKTSCRVSVLRHLFKPETNSEASSTDDGDQFLIFVLKNNHKYHLY